MCVIEILYIFVAGYTIYKYGRESVIKRFKKTGSKLQYFFRVQKCYFFLCLFCWTFDLFFLLVEFHVTREIYAIIRSIEPTIISLPWVISVLHSVFARRSSNVALEEELMPKESTDTAMNKNAVDDAMRREIVEYLMKGIRKSIISHLDSKAAAGVIIEEHEGIFHTIFKSIIGRFIGLNDEDDKKQEGSNYSFISEDPAVLSRVNLIEKKMIIREAKREVIVI